MSHSKQVVIVTGGSRGLGLGIVADLINSGYRVATCSRTSTTAIEKLSESPDAAQHLLWHPCEIGNPQQEEDFIRSVVEWAGDDLIFALVNNAAIARDGVLASFSPDSIEQLLAVNLAGALRLCRLVMRPLLRQAQPGRIINISSIVGSRGYTGLTAYAATKAGLDGLTRALAREVGRRSITVNSIAPGFLETDLSNSLDERQRKQIIKRTPLRRLGKPSDITPILRFLLSKEASFITGQTFTIDGGLTC